MGGGAGIDFKFEFDQFWVVRAKNNRRKFRVMRQPEITRWSLLGYEDGMTNVSGSLLTAEVIIPEIDAADADWMQNYNGIRPGDRLGAWVSECQWPHRMAWAGWTRGKWQSLFPMSIPFELTIEAFGTTPATLVIKLADCERFRRFWLDVFDFDPEIPGDLDIHRHNLHTYYGVTA